VAAIYRFPATATVGQGRGGRSFQRRRDRIVEIGHDATRALDRYIRGQHPQAYRPQLWLGVSNRGPMTASGCVGRTT
jgi:hypothetical protein